MSPFLSNVQVSNVDGIVVVVAVIVCALVVWGAMQFRER